LRRLIGPSVDASITPPPNATRLLACRVDALVLAFKLDRERLATRLVHRLELAARGAVELVLGRHAFELRAREQTSRAWFQNADLRGTLDLKADNGWHLEIVLRAAFLARHPLEQALRLAVDVADAFGHVTDGPRLRRVDLAADFVGFPLAKGDAECFATMRATLSEFRAEAKDVGEVPTAIDSPHLRIHRDKASSITGFSVSSGNPVSARAYDKTAELAVLGREEKRGIEHALWEQRGWRGEAVTRVEFQLRGEALDDFKLRDARKLEANLDGLWQYATRKWLRLIDPTSATRRDRCALDPRWEAVQEVCFVHTASPAKRSRLRGGAKAEQALGANLSLLAKAGRLRRVQTGCDRDGVPFDELAFVGRMTEPVADEWARDYATNLFGEAGTAIVDCLAAKYGIRKAALNLAIKTNAAVARFSSIDDQAEREQ
jgi:hypothetical protein